MQSTDLHIKSFDISPVKMFGHCLFDIRQAHGLSQKAVALDTGMDQSYLAGLETGRRPPPRDKQLHRLFAAIQMTDMEKCILQKARALYKLFQAIDELSHINPRGAGVHNSLLALCLNQIYQELFEVYQFTQQESVMS